jgi:hypothetical protein
MPSTTTTPRYLQQPRRDRHQDLQPACPSWPGTLGLQPPYLKLPGPWPSFCARTAEKMPSAPTSTSHSYVRWAAASPPLASKSSSNRPARLRYLVNRCPQRTVSGSKASCSSSRKACRGTWQFARPSPPTCTRQRFSPPLLFADAPSALRRCSCCRSCRTRLP